jgi:glycerophosphoryl diester phosphodiesterase
VEEALSRLSFRPAIYSPYHKLLTAEEVKLAHSAGVAVIPWTVNDPERMAELLAWGVDGLISDDPGLALNALVDRQ